MMKTIIETLSFLGKSSFPVQLTQTEKNLRLEATNNGYYARLELDFTDLTYRKPFSACVFSGDLLKVLRQIPLASFELEKCLLVRGVNSMARVPILDSGTICFPSLETNGLPIWEKVVSSLGSMKTWDKISEGLKQGMEGCLVEFLTWGCVVSVIRSSIMAFKSVDFSGLTSYRLAIPCFELPDIGTMKNVSFSDNGNHICLGFDVDRGALELWIPTFHDGFPTDLLKMFKIDSALPLLRKEGSKYQFSENLVSVIDSVLTVADNSKFVTFDPIGTARDSDEMVWKIWAKAMNGCEMSDLVTSTGSKEAQKFSVTGRWLSSALEWCGNGAVVTYGDSVITVSSQDDRSLVLLAMAVV